MNAEDRYQARLRRRVAGRLKAAAIAIAFIAGGLAFWKGLSMFMWAAYRAGFTM